MRWKLYATNTLRGNPMLTSDFKEFAACYARRISMVVDDLALSFISLNDFKTNKRAVGRHQDLADLETLERQ